MECKKTAEKFIEDYKNKVFNSISLEINENVMFIIPSIFIKFFMIRKFKRLNRAKVMKKTKKRMINKRVWLIKRYIIISMINLIFYFK